MFCLSIYKHPFQGKYFSVNKVLNFHSFLLNDSFFNISICYSDIAIARAQVSKDINVLASEIGLLPSEISPYGNKKAKVSLATLDRLAHQKNGKYVVVTG